MSLMKRPARWSRLAASAVAVAAGALIFSARPSAQIFILPVFAGFNLVDLGAGSPNVFANGINAVAQVTGTMPDPLNRRPQVAYRTQPNQIPFGSDALAPLLNDDMSAGFAVDDAGGVVGDSQRSGSASFRAVRWTANGTILNLHPAGAATSSMRGTNNVGWFVGHFTRPGDPIDRVHPFLTWGAGTELLLDSLLNNPFSATAMDINDLDQVVGTRVATASSQPRAYMFDMAANVFKAMDIAPLPGGIFNRAFAINESSQVVGQSDRASGRLHSVHAFLFKDANRNQLTDAGELVDLDTLGTSQSAALAINGNGSAVGFSGDPTVTFGTSRAMIFQNGTMVDLNTQLLNNSSGMILRVATGINDQGQIVGFMENNVLPVEARVRRAFRLDPVFRRR